MHAMRLGFLLAACGLSVFAQFTSASLTGAVTDSSGAAVPGAAILAQETRTGINTRGVTNEEGLYSFPSLPVGRYRVSAEKTGFQKQLYNNIVLEVGGRLSLDFTLSPGQVVEVVEVRAELENVLGVTSTSVGGLVTGQKVLNLPIVSRDALSFVYLQAGVVGNNFAGARRGALNISMDGINIQDNRINTGVASTVSTSIDRVEEFRVVTSPADAEYGRGSGQIQLISRSGTNEFHGSLFEFHRNTAFNANTWFNNQRGHDRDGNQISPRNILLRHQFGARMGGPIIKNRTFFHFLYEGQRQITRNAVTNTVLTEEARRGLYRFFPGARNGNAEAAVPTVDLNGQPLRPAAATGPLSTVNLFQVDPARARLDPTGSVAKWLSFTPLPNNFRSGDGLNTAGFTWSRPATNDGDQYVLKLDHNFNPAHRTSFSYQREASSQLNGFMAQRFPTAPGGTFSDKAMLTSIAITSTLRPTLLNEFRAGTQRPRVRFNAPWEVNDGEVLPVRGATPYMLVPLSYTSPIQNDQDPQGRISPVYQYADTMTWIKGKHQFKGGAEVRWVSSNGFNSFTVVPRANIGAGVLAAAPVQAIAGIGLNAGLAANILNDLTGTLTNSTQAFNATGGRTPQYVPGEPRQRTWRQRELSWFFKDEWKVSPALTLNLGVRWEYYGQPYEALGRTSRLKNGSSDIFGISGADFSSLFRPGLAQGQLVDAILVGRNSPNPNEKLYADDRNNFAPAVGLTWSLPWFGENKTVLRMGYGWGYERNSLRNLDVFAADLPGLRTVTNFRSPNPLQLANLTLPLTPIGAPLERIPLTDRGTTTYAFDSGLRAPYTQNWNLSLQRALVKNTTLEIRYVGSKSTRLLRATNVNETNIFENGILDAFNITQAGGNAPLFDAVFNGLNVSGLGRVNGTTITGSDAIRALQAAAFAGNNTGTIANYLNVNAFAGQPGDLLRRAGLPENFVVANPQFAGATFLSNFANATYHSLQVEVIKRTSAGLEFQANWTYSKALGEEEGDGQSLLDSYRTVRNRRADKRLLTFNRTHVFRSNMIYELPFGRKGKLFTGANGVADRIIGGWQVSTIVNLFTGAPITVLSERSSFNNFGGDNTPSATANIDKSLGQVLKTGNGVVYFNGIRQVTDPSVANMTTRQNIRSTSTLQALVDASGNMILRNTIPGELGNLASTFFTGPGSIRVDMRLAKTIRIKERKELQFTLDAENLTNTPNFNDPNTAINSVNFGRITGAGGNRIMLLGGRFNF
jgi:hypothetical protein